MALLLEKGRVKQEATYNAAGSNYELGSSVSGHVDITSAFSASQRFPYWVVSQSGTGWKRGVGYWASGTPDTMESVSIIESGGTISDDEAVFISVGPQPLLPTICGFAAMGYKTLTGGGLFIPDSDTWDTIHDPYGMWDGTNDRLNFPTGFPTAAFRVSATARVTSGASDGTYQELYFFYKTGESDVDYMKVPYINNTSYPIHLVSPIKVRNSTASYTWIKGVYGTDDTNELNMQIFWSVELFPGDPAYWA